jgi:hypothetical protein
MKLTRYDAESGRLVKVLDMPVKSVEELPDGPPPDFKYLVSLSLGADSDGLFWNIELNEEEFELIKETLCLYDE